MAFGINRSELEQWKQDINNGQIAFITHYWLDERFLNCDTVTKVGCRDLDKLIAWGREHGLKAEWIDQREKYPHFDLFGTRQKKILSLERQWEQIERFNL